MAWFGVLVAHRSSQSVSELMTPYSFWQEETCPCARTAADQTPDPSCQRCRGTGAYPEPSDNPNVKWDIYCIGGAFSGVLTGYDPQQQPANWERGPLCRGTGRRPETIALNPELGCNGCSGQGKSLKHALKWKPYAGDLLPVSFLLRLSPDFAPDAVVTPDGRWIEEGLAYDLTRPITPEAVQAMKPRLRELLEPHQDCFATIVWCHF